MIHSLLLNSYLPPWCVIFHHFSQSARLQHHMKLPSLLFSQSLPYLLWICICKRWECVLVRQTQNQNIPRSIPYSWFSKLPLSSLFSSSSSSSFSCSMFSFSSFTSFTFLLLLLRHLLLLCLESVFSIYSSFFFVMIR